MFWHVTFFLKDVFAIGNKLSYVVYLSIVIIYHHFSNLKIVKKQRK